MKTRSARRVISIAAKTAGVAVLIAAGTVAGAIFLLPRFTTIQTLTVLTGSMEPSIPKGSVVFVRPTAPNQLAVGDVITFYDKGGSGATITHRVSATPMTTDGRVFRTKGDSNKADDPHPVEEDRIVGKVAFDIPLVGRLSQYAGTPRGKLLVVALPLAVFGGYNLLTLVRELRSSYRRKRDDGAADVPAPSVVRLWRPGDSAAIHRSQVVLVAIEPAPDCAARLLHLISSCGGRILESDDASALVELVGEPAEMDEIVRVMQELGTTSVSKSSIAFASLRDVGAPRLLRVSGEQPR
jgi:signal peptidase I